MDEKKRRLMQISKLWPCAIFFGNRTECKISTSGSSGSLSKEKRNTILCLDYSKKFLAEAI